MKVSVISLSSLSTNFFEWSLFFCSFLYTNPLQYLLLQTLQVLPEQTEQDLKFPLVSDIPKLDTQL